jgi:putative ABC transport system permease protein
MKGQALAIALVVAAGVAMFVTYMSTSTRCRTLDAYYDHQRFADVLPPSNARRGAWRRYLAALPGVAAVRTRVVADVTLDVPGWTGRYGPAHRSARAGRGSTTCSEAGPLDRAGRGDR